MAEATMTIQQFGAQVKSKYPAYSQYSDEEIGDRMLQKYPVYKDRVTSTAPGAFSPKTPNQISDIESGQKYGAWAPANTQNPSAIGEGSKVLANMAPSAWNFVKGAADLFNPLSAVNKLKQAATEFQGLVGETGGYGSALKAVGKELIPAAYETMVPEAGRALISAGGGVITGNEQKTTEGLKTAQRAIVNDPVGQIAPFLIAGRAGAEALDRTGITKGAGSAFDTGISKVAQPVIRPVEAVARGAKNIVTGTTKFGIGQATGLQPETIGQIVKTPEAFTREARGAIDRASLGQEVQSSLAQKSNAMAETGQAYAPIRESTTPIKVATSWLDTTIKDLTGVDIKKGQIEATGASVLRDASDIRAMQHLYDLWKPVFRRGNMTANEFLNFRTDLANLSKFDRQIGKSQPIESMAKLTRGRFNEAYRPQLEGLESLDREFSAQTAELKRLSKNIVDKNGNLTDAAINRIANATGKGKDILLSRLEETVPGITQKIKVLKAIEDIQHASGIKVGTYGRTLGMAGGYALGGVLGVIIEGILTSPDVAVPLLRRYGLIKNSTAVQAVVNALRSGGRSINQMPNTPPEILNKDVRKMPIGLSIEDVTKITPKMEKEARFYIKKDIPITRDTINLKDIRGRGLKEGEMPSGKENLTKPVIVAKMSDGSYQLIDGRHRLDILEKKGNTKIDAIIANKQSKPSAFGPKKLSSNLGSDLQPEAVAIMDDFNRGAITKEQASQMVKDLIERGENIKKSKEALAEYKKMLADPNADTETRAFARSGIKGEQDYLAKRAKPSAFGLIEKPTVFQGYPDLTTQFLEYAKGKTTFSKQEIMDFAKRPELKKGEADLLMRKLKEFDPKKIPINTKEKLFTTPEKTKERGMRLIEKSFGDKESAISHAEQYWAKEGKAGVFHHATKETSLFDVFEKGKAANMDIGLRSGISNVNGLYVGRDPKALHEFYNIAAERGDNIITYKGNPKLLDLTDEDAMMKFTDKFKTGNQIEKELNRGGYDGIKYFDPYATGEEIVITNQNVLKPVAFNGKPIKSQSKILAQDFADSIRRDLLELKPVKMNPEKLEVGLEIRRPLGEKWIITDIPANTYYHGTQAADFKSFKGLTYLTDDPLEAKGFAEGNHLGGGRGGKPRTIEVTANLKKIKNIDDAVEEALMEGNLDETIAAEVAKAKKEGYDAVSFTHPSNYTDGEFTATVPVDNSLLKIKGKTTLGK